MDGETIRRRLADFAARLDTAGIEARIILVGGAALSFYYDRQLTADIDAALHPTDAVLAHARAFAAEEGLPRDWLNNAAVGFFPHEEVPGMVAIQHGCVSIEVAEPEVLLAMKLRASRPRKDTFDIAFLLRRCGISSVEEAVALLDRYFPEEEMPRRGFEMVRSALGEITLPTDPPTHLEAVLPRPAAVTCGRWVLREDGKCALPSGHGGDCSARPGS
jgi:hypothetical protein